MLFTLLLKQSKAYFNAYFVISVINWSVSHPVEIQVSDCYKLFCDYSQTVGHSSCRGFSFVIIHKPVSDCSFGDKDFVSIIGGLCLAWVQKTFGTQSYLCIHPLYVKRVESSSLLRKGWSVLLDSLTSWDNF